jgi:O-antigen/teichoic acid export membrane protein
MNSLKEISLRAMSWSIFDRFSVQFVNLFSSIILARLLSPTEYGYIAIVTIFITISQVVVDNGLSQSIIASNSKGNDVLSSVFTFNFIVSILIYLLLLVSASSISLFFKAPVLQYLIPVLAINLILHAVSNVHRIRLQMDLNFKRTALIQLPGLFISSCTAIVLALWGFGVWSLVAQQIILQLYITLTLWINSSWKPQLILNKNALKPHLKYGYFVSLNAFLSSVFHYVYDLLIGKYFSKELLGQYGKAFSLKQLPHENLTIPIINVSFPLFSLLKNDENNLNLKYKRLLSQLCYIITPIYVLIAIFSKEIVLLLFGAQWKVAGTCLFWLSISGIFQHVVSLNVSLFKLHFRNIKISFLLEFISKIIFFSGAFLLIPYGIISMLIFHVCFSFMFMIFWMLNLQWFSAVSFFDQFYIFFKPLLLSLLSAFSVYAFSKFDFLNYNIMFNIIKIIIFLLLYTFLSFTFMRKTFYETIDVISLRLSPLFSGFRKLF